MISTKVKHENVALHQGKYITEMSQHLLSIETFYSIENNTYPVTIYILRFLQVEHNLYRNLQNQESYRK
jgi:hypothetical protein